MYSIIEIFGYSAEIRRGTNIKIHAKSYRVGLHWMAFFFESSHFQVFDSISDITAPVSYIVDKEGT